MKFILIIFFVTSSLLSAQTMGDYIELIDACQLGDLEGAKASLAKGVDVNQPDGEMLPPLVHALSAKQFDVARYLIENGAQVNNKKAYREPMFCAIQAGNVDIIELMLKKGAKVGPQEGHSPVETTLILGNLEILNLLIKHGATLDQDAIFTAAFNRNLDIVEHLLKTGADPNGLSSKGVSLLGIAAWSDYPKLIELTLKHGADPNVINRGFNRRYFHEILNSPLSAAVLMNHAGIVKMLLDAGADPNLLDNQAIKYADLVGDHEIYDLLIEHGAREQGPYAYLDLDFQNPAGLRMKPIQEIKREARKAFDLQLIANQKPVRGEQKIPAEPIVVAVIPTNEASRQTEPLITAALSQLNFVQLVERAELQIVLDEQHLSYNGLQEAATSIAQGNLLGADALVVLAETDKGSEAYFVATATGLIAESLFYKPGNPVQWAGELSKSFKSRAHLFGESPSEWTLVSTPNITSSRGTAEDVKYAQDINKALALSLGAQDGIFILERQQMDRLVGEKILTQDQRDFFGSGWHIDGTTEWPSAPTEPLKITIQLAAAGNLSPESFTVSGSVEEPTALLQELTFEIMKRVSDSEPRQWSAKEEAKKYAEQAKQYSKGGIWQRAYCSAEAAWALGERTEATLEIRLLSIIQRMKNSYEISFLSDRLDDSFMSPEKVLKLLAPTFIDPVDPRELDRYELIKLAHDILDIYEPILAKGKSMDAFEQDLFTASGQVFRVVNYPLEMLQSLSDQKKHRAELDLLRTRLRDACLSGLEVAKAHKMPRLHGEIWAVYMRNLPYLIPDQEKLTTLVKSELDDLTNWEALYPKSHALWYFYELTERFSRWPAGRGISFWQHYARILARDKRTDLRLMGLTLSQRDAHSDREIAGYFPPLLETYLEHWRTDTSVLDFRVIDNIEYALSKSSTILGVRKWEQSPAWIDLFGHRDADVLYYRHVASITPFDPLVKYYPPIALLPGKPHQNKEARLVASIAKIRKEMRKERLEVMTQTGAATCPHGFFEGFALEEAKQLESLFQLAVARIQKRANSLSRPKILQEFREEIIEKKFKPILAQAEESHDELDPGTFHVPYLEFRKLAPDIRLPDLKKNLGVNGVVGIRAFPGTDQACVLLSRGEYLIRFDTASHTFQAPLVLPDPLQASDYQRPALGTIFTPDSQYLALDAQSEQARTSNENYFYGVACYDFLKKEWKLFQSPEFSFGASHIVGIPCIVVLKNNLYYSFASGPKKKGGDSSRDFWARETTTKGIKKLNLTTGEETFLVNPRRNPPLSPLDGKKWKYGDWWMTRISHEQLRFGGYIYDEAKDEWKKVSNARRITERMERDLSWKGFSIYVANYNAVDQVLTVSVSKDRRKIAEVGLKVPIDSLKEFEIPAEYPEVRNFHQSLKTGGYMNTLKAGITPQGIYLFNSLGFFFLPKEGVVSRVEQNLGLGGGGKESL